MAALTDCVLLVTAVQVRRCDEANGEGGVDGWLGGCPYASVKGYSWHSESRHPAPDTML